MSILDNLKGYSLEMICADFWPANLDHGGPETLLFSMNRFFKFLPGEQRQAFLEDMSENSSAHRRTTSFLCFR